MNEIELKTLLGEHIHHAEVHVEDIRGNGSHFRAVVSSPEFVGKSLVEQHRMVYDACSEYMKREIHALEIETLIPDEVQHRSATNNRTL
jgi:stress-induced morphogen